jgi:hypothetical protein
MNSFSILASSAFIAVLTAVIDLCRGGLED